jgi:L-alanine-DL-glutamate epimerase-like enolase superfamily enzyme
VASIEQVTVTVFRTTAKTEVDSAGHRHPGPRREVREALLTITDSDGVAGHCLAHPEHLRESVLAGHVRPVLVGADGLQRERLWHRLARRQRGSGGLLTDRALGYVDQALADLGGRVAGLPVWLMLGGARPSIPAYASTMCGDEIPGGLATPADYAVFAKQLVALGYRAIKLHTWMPPARGGADVNLDIAACTAVRDAVGPDIELMLDAYHWYSRTEALRLGRALAELGYYWFEEPMEEASLQSYRWLAEQLAVPVVGPETSWGKHLTRAEWVLAGACDILRAGVLNTGGITPTLKAMHLAEAFNMDCEVHGGGSGNLAVLGASACGRWYERGLVHPLVDYDEVPPHLRSLVDTLDDQGRVAMPTRPGLGDDFDFDHIGANTVARW